MSAGALGVGGEVHLSAVADQAPPAEVLGQVLAETATAAIEREAGLVLTLDELHAAPPGELGLLATILQENVPNGWPLVVVGAALPSFRINRGPRQLPTYLARLHGGIQEP